MYRSVEQNRVQERFTLILPIHFQQSCLIQWRKDGLFNEWYWKNWISTCKGKETNLMLASYHIQKLTQNELWA